jgi:hypothetical protein
MFFLFDARMNPRIRELCDLLNDDPSFFVRKVSLMEVRTVAGASFGQN